MPIPGTSSNNSKDIFYTEQFKKIIRSEKDILLKQASAFPILKPRELYAFRYDIYRFLRANNIPEHLWWATAYLNGIEDPNQDISGLQVLYQVDESILVKALTRANTKQG